jgi:hypothetical protein
MDSNAITVTYGYYNGELLFDSAVPTTDASGQISYPFTWRNNDAIRNGRA